MVKVNDIAFVCYPVTDRQPARDFYEGLLGLKESSSGEFPEGFWAEYEFGSGTFAISNYWKPPAQPFTGPAVGFEVEDFPDAISRLKENNVPFPQEVMETPVCHLAVVTDPDGNSLFIHKRKPGHN